MIKEEAIEILSDMRAEYNIFSDDEEEATRYHALSWAIQALNERTGRWEYVKKRLVRGGYVDASECSVCHKRIMPHLKPNFCPNCGARMEEEERWLT